TPASHYDKGCRERSRAALLLQVVALANLLDAAGEVERILGDFVVPAFEDVAAGAKRFGYTNMGSGTPRIGFGDEERLGEVVLQLARALDHHWATDSFGT